MTSHELLKQLSLLQNGTLDENLPSYFVTIVTTISRKSNQELPSPFEERPMRTRVLDFFLLGKSSRESKLVPDRDEVIKDLLSFLRSIDLKRYFISLSEYEAILSESKLVTKNIELNDLPYHLERFARLMEDYIRQRGEIGELLEAAETLNRNFRILAMLRQFVEDNLEMPAEMPTSRSGLSLLLSLDTNYDLFLEKLHALRVIYDELCSLFGVSAKEIPLEIGKVESGSLWIKLFGESRVIAAMVSLIESTVLFFHRNFTTEGQIMTVPKRIESVVSLLELEQKLKEAGLETAELKEYIHKSSVLIGRSLTQLLAGEAKVEVNGNEYSLGSDLERVYMAQAQTLFLSDAKSRSDGKPDTVE